MSYETIRWARDTAAGGPGPKALLLALASHADDDHACYPGQALLAAETDQGERTARRHLAALEAAGLIRREHRPRTGPGGAGRRTDRYVLAAETTGQPGRLIEEQPAKNDRTTGQKRQEQPATSGRKGTTSRSAREEGAPSRRRRAPAPVDQTISDNHAFFARYAAELAASAPTERNTTA